MKIGIISDIHSNIDALNKVFEEFDKQDVDNYICLGDFIGIGPNPEECVNKIIERKDKFISIIRGNHENYFVNGLPERNHNVATERLLTPDEIGNHTWNHNNLSKESSDFIYSLKNNDVVSVGKYKILVEHYSTDFDYKFRKFSKTPTENIIFNDLYFDKKDYEIYLFGHTHISYYNEINNKYYINPGSVGCPKTAKAASCGILTIEDDKVSYNWNLVKYDIDKVINDMRNINYPLWNEMVDIFYI